MENKELDVDSSGIAIPNKSYDDEPMTRKRSLSDAQGKLYHFSFLEGLEEENTEENNEIEDSEDAPPPRKKIKKMTDEDIEKDILDGHLEDPNKRRRSINIGLSDLLTPLKKSQQNDRVDELKNEENLAVLNDLETGNFLLNTDPLKAKQVTRDVSFRKVQKRVRRKWDKIDRRLENAKNIPFFFEENSTKNSSHASSGISMMEGSEKAESEKKKLTSEEEEKRKEEKLKEAQKIAFDRRQLSYFLSRRKRLKKIKSRDFRRRLRKRREKEEQKIFSEKFESDPAYVEQQLMKQQKSYIKERVTLRHKQASKWMKKLIKSGGGDSLRKVEKPSEEESVLLEEEMTNKTRKNRNFKETLDKLIAEEEGLMEEESNEKSGVFDMPFMKRSRERFLKEMKEMNSGQSNSESDSGKRVYQSNTSISRTVEKPGNKNILSSSIRSIIRPQQGNIEKNIVESEKAISLVLQKQEDKNPISNNNEFRARKRKRVFGEENDMLDEEEDVSNPWLGFGEYENSEIDNSESEKKKRKLVEHSFSFDKKKKENEKNDSSDFYMEMKHAAFASDGLEMSFRDLKKKRIDEDLEELDGKIVDKRLPGWGEWIGGDDEFDEDRYDDDDWEGPVKGNQREEAISKIKSKILGEKKEKRVDSELDNVIVSQSAMPDPRFAFKFKLGNRDYSKRKMFDNIASHPLGPDWNSFRGYDKLVSQKDSIPKRGKIILPLTKESFENVSEKID